jgi:ABC-type polysaccharide/polyol phosphate transport system ATPase subunit
MALIEVRNVSKRYYLHRKRELLAQSFFKRLRRQWEPFWALRDVSFSVGAGENVAVIGHNGAGKSTLLGLIAGVASPTEGTVRCSGKISALLELGTGFHPDLTGRENIKLNAALRGLNRSAIEERFESIIDFAEIRDFIDEPLRTYSSGMTARLGFSVAIHAEPEILVLDEVMSVGDQAFQKKCAGRIELMAASGVTLLFVSHSLAAVELMCPRTIWLDHGRVRMDGPTAQVAEAYETAMTGAAPSAAPRR